MAKKTFATVTGTGSVLGAYRAVRFSVTLRQKAETGPKAKEQRRPAYDLLQSRLRELREQNVITVVDGSWCATDNVSTEDQHRGGGYVATWQLRFDSADVARAAEIHDALTSIDGVQVSNPEFLIDCPDALRQHAYMAAIVAARATFAMQCTASGNDPSDFQVISVEFRDGSPQRRSMGLESLNSADPAPAEITPDRALVTATVTVEYRRRKKK